MSSSRSDRCVVNVSTGEHYPKGMARLWKYCEGLGETVISRTEIPADWPSHAEKPYAFKPYALMEAAAAGYKQLLWADACIVPIRPIDPIWDIAEREGAWISRNGYLNSEWTAESAYKALGVTREENDSIEHVVATSFAVDLRHEKGRKLLDEYFRLASETDAFCGPWRGGIGVQHRHDQTALSVIAWRLGIPLTNPPEYFAYWGSETADTILIAAGAY